MKVPDTQPQELGVQAGADASEVVEPEPVDDGGRGQLPIAISEGDFSTPTKRTRTITRPRGLKTLEQTSSLRTPESSPSVEIGTGVDLQPPAREASAVDEFLAAPPTPEPEVNTNTPMPDFFPAAADAVRPFDVSPPQPGETVDGAGAVDGYTVDVFATLEVEDPSEGTDAAETVTDNVEDRLPDGAPLGSAVLQGDLAGALPTAEPPAQSDVDIVVVPDLIALDDVPPLPAPLPDAEPTLEAAADEAMTAEHDPQLSPLAQTLANMAEAMQVDLAEAAEEIDLGDAPLIPLPPDPTGAADRARGPGGRVPPPPPPIADPSPPVAAPVAEVPPPLSPLLVLPEALAERPRRSKRSKPWFEEVFDESYLRTLPFMTAEQTLREVDFIESSLAVPKGGEVLDVACGYGRHAIELVQRGLAVTGLDLSLPLLIRAADESQRRAVAVNFVHTDMREISFERQFAGAYCMLTSFGYFDEESNLKVAEGIARALKPGGRFLIDVINRDYIVGDLPARIWWEGDGCVVLEEVDFNFNTNRILTRRSVVFEDGHQLEQEISVRAYSLHELGKLLRQAGFRVIEVSGSIPTRGNFFGAYSRNLLVLAERRGE